MGSWEKKSISWLFLADLFDILLPMLNIYQEFVRNHQYSLQVLANCKQNRDFDKLLKQYEANPACEGRMLETFLTYPMFQVVSVYFLWLFVFNAWLIHFVLLTLQLIEDSSRLTKPTFMQINVFLIYCVIMLNLCL